MTLFVSDLDGTLLNSNKEISEFSRRELNRLIKEKDMKFAIATARTPATVVDIFEGVNINIPAILMNGVVLYDIQKEKYIKINDIEKEVVKKVIEVFQKHNKEFFLYGIKENHIWVYYTQLTNEAETLFYKERCKKRLKTFVQIENYTEILEDLDVINFIVFDNECNIKNIYNDLSKIKGLHADYYKDIYGDDYYLDAYSSNASKANGIKSLREYIKCDEIIVFGDNVNDEPMFKVSDKGCAVSNATEKLKSIATDVIDSNENDGVVKFINNYIKNK